MMQEKYYKYNNILPYFVITAFSICYLSLTNFSYAPITEGWFVSIAELIRSGKLPYKDFNLYLPPLYAYIQVFLNETFGIDFFAYRCFGIILMVLMSIYIYKLLRIKFDTYICVALACFSVVFYAQGNAFISYDFTQVMSLLLLASIYYTVLACNIANTDSQKASKYTLAAGILTSTAGLIKQSNPVVFFIFQSLLIINSLGNAKANILNYFLGISIPLVALLVWLVLNGLSVSFYEQVFVGAVSAKGDFLSILVGWISRLPHSFTNYIVVMLLLTICVLYRNNIKIILTDFQNRCITYNRTIISCAVFGALCTSILIAYNEINLYNYAGFSFASNIVGKANILTLLVILTYFFCCAILKDSNKYLNSVFFLSLGLIIGNATSAGFNEISTYISIAVILGFIVSCFRYFALFCIFFISVSSYNIAFAKFKTPYYWWAVSEPSIHDTFVSVAEPKEFVRMRLTSQRESMYAEISSFKHLIGNEGTVYAFPSIPLVYLLTGTSPQTRSVIQWFDFMPDSAGREEIDSLNNFLPTYIFILDYPDFVYTMHETLFRDSKESSQRKILHKLNKIVGTKYFFVKSYEISPEVILRVYSLNPTKN